MDLEGQQHIIVLLLLLHIIIVISFNPLDKPELGIDSGNFRLISTANRKSKIHARGIFFSCGNINNFAATGAYFCVKHYYIRR